MQRGADPNRANKDGRTPLFWANTPEAVDALGHKGASAAHRDASCRTALEYCRATFPNAAVMAPGAPADLALARADLELRQAGPGSARQRAGLVVPTIARSNRSLVEERYGQWHG